MYRNDGVRHKSEEFSVNKVLSLSDSPIVTVFIKLTDVQIKSIRNNANNG